jgi:hypothetical protein
MYDEEEPKAKSPLLTYAQVTFLVKVLRSAIVYERLLSSFERGFVDDLALNYSKYGEKIRVTGKQWAVFDKIQKRLRLELTLPEGIVLDDDSPP